MVHKNEVVIWGAGGHGKVVADILTGLDSCNVFGFFEDEENQTDKDIFLGKNVYKGFERLLEARDEGATHIIFGFGDCSARMKCISLLEETGLSSMCAIHYRATIARDVAIGEGVAVMAGAVVNPGSAIGGHSIINTGCTIDHDCSLGIAVHVGPGVHLGGRVSIGDGTWVGLGALISDGLAVGSNVVVGAGSVVLHDIPDNVVAIGCPAKIVREAD